MLFDLDDHQRKKSKNKTFTEINVLEVNIITTIILTILFVYLYLEDINIQILDSIF